MRAVKSKDTGPEMVVRRLLHAHGFRYRLHQRTLPGSPDLVFPGMRKVVFVNGCFWHGHDCVRGSRMPKAHARYWQTKIERNRRRDEKVRGQLQDQGWQVLVVWECEIANPNLLERLAKFLQTNKTPANRHSGR